MIYKSRITFMTLDYGKYGIFLLIWVMQDSYHQPLPMLCSCNFDGVVMLTDKSRFGMFTLPESLM